MRKNGKRYSHNCLLPQESAVSDCLNLGDALAQDFEKLFSERALGGGGRPGKDHVRFKGRLKGQKRDFIIGPGDAVNSDGIASGADNERGVVEQVVGSDDVKPLKGIVEPARHFALNEALFGKVKRQINEV